MNDQESENMGRYVGWGLLGLIILAGASIVTSLFFFVPNSSGTFYPIFPFFPFHAPGILESIFLIFIIFWAARWWFWRGSHHTSYSEYRDPAHDKLRERYAKGEITKEQFEQIMRDLKLYD